MSLAESTGLNTGGADCVPSIETVSDDMLDPELVADLPVEWARANLLLPIRMDGHVFALCVQAGCVSEQEYLALLLGHDVTPVLASEAVVSQAIERCYYRRDNSPSEFLESMSAESEEGMDLRMSDDLLQVAEKAPVTQLINLILLEALKRGASDIHFEPFSDEFQVRYRVDGVLYSQSKPPKYLESALVSRLKVMARMDIAEKRLPQDGMARVRIGNREIDIRVSTVPVAEGERVVLRLLDRDAALLPLSDLGMSADVLAGFERLMRRSNGMVVVSGPTGSGKTTTLYAALGRLDAGRRNIMTIENPIEYQLPGIGQIQVKSKIGLTFAEGLRHILRQDPDIVLVGETRDLETAEIAVRASLTGHLVLTTLHTNDAPGAILRLIDMGVEPYLLASCLRGVLAQRLVRKLCPFCSRERLGTAEDAAMLGLPVEVLDGQVVRDAVGCTECLEGFRGRIGIFELMVLDSRVQDLVRGGSLTLDSLRGAAGQQGMPDMLADGVARVRDGMTTVQELGSVVAAG
jgi:general secretion pathway protein E